MDDFMVMLETLVRASESCRLISYDDATGETVAAGGVCKGTLTIGWGDTADVRPGMIISQAEADARLAARLPLAAEDAAHCVGAIRWAALDLPRRAALADMAYNLGRFRLEGFHHMLFAVASGDWRRAHDEALAPHWLAQVGRRATRDALILLTGDMPARP